MEEEQIVEQEETQVEESSVQSAIEKMLPEKIDYEAKINEMLG